MLPIAANAYDQNAYNSPVLVAPAPAPQPLPSPTPSLPAAPRTDLQSVAALTDEFEGGSLDDSKWSDRFIGWTGEGRYDPQGTRLFRFDPENVAVADGRLSLTAQHDPDPDQLFTTSAVYSTNTLLYGYVEIRAKIAPSNLSSNFWLVNNTQPDYKSEIDVFEQAGGSRFADQFNTTLHVWHLPTHRPRQTDRLVIYSEPRPIQTAEILGQAGADLTADYYTYGLDWTPESITISIDGQVVSQQPNTYWHQPMHLVIDREAYQSWFPWPEADEPLGRYEVDYVRAWQTPEQAAATPLPGISGDLLTLPTQPGWQVIDSADFDRDGQTDLLAYNALERRTQLWLLGGAETGYGLQSTVEIGFDPGRVPLGAGDFDGDGSADLVMQQFTFDGWIGTEVLLMDGVRQTGAALPYNHNASWDYEPVAIGDFNQDGRADIISQWDSPLPEDRNKYKKLWLNNGVSVDGSSGRDRYEVDITRDLPTWVNWDAIAAGDFDQDGRDEVILRNSEENWNGKMIDRNLILFLSDAAGLRSSDFSTRVRGTAPLEIPAGWEIVGAASFNTSQNSSMDLLVRNPSTGQNGVVLLPTISGPVDPLNLPIF